MKYRFRKPEPGPTIAIIFVTALMFSLGIWQIVRLQWKTNLLAHIEQIQSEPPKNLLAFAPEVMPDQEWHNVIVHGWLLNDKELYATPRFYKDQMGYAILTPLATGQHFGTQYVIINRGWVPPQKKEPATRAGGNTPEPVIVEGVIRGHFKQTMFRPDNVPERNLWFWYDLPAMQKQLGLPLLPVMIDATRITYENGSPVAGGPTPFPLEINIRNDHLGYAITWFLIGISGLVIFALYYLEPKRKSGDSF